MASVKLMPSLGCQENIGIFPKECAVFAEVREDFRLPPQKTAGALGCSQLIKSGWHSWGQQCKSIYAVCLQLACLLIV